MHSTKDTTWRREKSGGNLTKVKVLICFCSSVVLSSILRESFIVLLNRYAWKKTNEGWKRWNWFKWSEGINLITLMLIDSFSRNFTSSLSEPLVKMETDWNEGLQMKNEKVEVLQLTKWYYTVYTSFHFVLFSATLFSLSMSHQQKLYNGYVER